MSLKKILGNIGCTALSTIAPPIGGMAADVLKNVLGLNKDAKGHEIEAALEKATPEQIVKLKEAEYNFKIQLKKLDIDVENIEAKDRNSARRREMALKDKTPAVLSALITLGFFGLLFLIIFYPIPQGTKDTLQIMIGVLGTAWTGVVTYYFGSSHGSAKKNDILAEKK